MRVSIKLLTNVVFTFLCVCGCLFFFLNLLYNSPAQRSAQELPLVEKQSTDSFPVTGGKKMVLTGHNFLQDSKVIFVEKAPGMSFQSRLQSAFPPTPSVSNDESTNMVMTFSSACNTFSISLGKAVERI